MVEAFLRFEAGLCNHFVCRRSLSQREFHNVSMAQENADFSRGGRQLYVPARLSQKSSSTLELPPDYWATSLELGVERRIAF